MDLRRDEGVETIKDERVWEVLMLLDAETAGLEATGGLWNATRTVKDKSIVVGRQCVLGERYVRLRENFSSIANIYLRLAIATAFQSLVRVDSGCLSKISWLALSFSGACPPCKISGRQLP